MSEPSLPSSPASASSARRVRPRTPDAWRWSAAAKANVVALPLLLIAWTAGTWAWGDVRLGLMAGAFAAMSVAQAAGVVAVALAGSEKRDGYRMPVVHAMLGTAVVLTPVVLLASPFGVYALGALVLPGLLAMVALGFIHSHRHGTTFLNASLVIFGLLGTTWAAARSALPPCSSKVSRAAAAAVHGADRCACAVAKCTRT